MIKKIENEFWFLYTVGDGGEIVPHSLIRRDRCTRTECLKRIQRKMQRERVGGGVSCLSFELELGQYQASAWCDAAESVSDEVGQAFFRAMMGKVLPSLASVGV